MDSSKRNRLKIAILGVVSLISCLIYLAVSARNAGLGFPLDDAWIHQTFARNFGVHHVWSFQMGLPSGGSTGPLWGMILSLFYWSGLDPIWGTYFLGLILLWGASVTGYYLAKHLMPESKSAPILVGMIIALEWHLVWSALSGMETLLLGLISLLVFLWLERNDGRLWIPGILIGISTWVRPDGLTLIGPVLLVLGVSFVKGDRKPGYLAQFLGGLILTAGPYFLFNRVVAGEYWPNTFYAKQAEYALLRQANYLVRYGRVSLQVVTGIGVVLLPGFLRECLDIFHERDLVRASMLAWMIGFIGIYAWRLPVVYQHGRYIMPAMLVYIVLSSVGLIRILRPNSDHAWKRIASKGIMAAGSLVLVVFWGLGARAYARDVGVIETEMVRTAFWIKDHTSPGAVIGAHDIGALGYFSDRQILDLAGLISPDVIPFIRDEERLAVYLDQRQADYLVAFPSWYPVLVSNLELVYETDGKYAAIFGEDHLAVYKWE